jgi:2',3'-cyclic-nucleotide 2'-phosphodiesterase (5'-nucleotidase family)
VKRLSSKIMTSVLTASLIISLVGCASTATKVEQVPSTPVAEAPVPAEKTAAEKAAAEKAAAEKAAAEKAAAQKAAAEKAAAEKAAAEKAAAQKAAAEKLAAKKTTEYPYNVSTIVKSDKAVSDFDLYIAATGNVKGALDGIDYAKLATLLKAGRSLTADTLLLDAGNATSGSALVESFGGEPAGVLMAMLGYDAVAPGAGDFAYGTARLEQAASYAYQNTSLKVLSANTLTKKGNPVFQPYQVYYFNGKTVLVAGLTSPAAAKNDTEGLSFTDPVIIKNAQAAVDMAKSMVDYVVVLGNVDDSQYTAKLICQNIKGIDLFVEASDKPYTEMVNGTTLVGTGAGLQQIGLVDVSVKGDRMSTKVLGFVSASDINDPAHSALAKQYGIASIPADNDVACYLAKVSAAYAEKMMTPVQKAAAEKAAAEKAAAQKAAAQKAAAQKAAAEKAAAEKAAAEKAAAQKAAAEKLAAKKTTEYPYNVSTIVKSDKAVSDFDLYIAATGNVKGALDGIDYAKLATLLKAGRSLTADTLLLDAGNATSGSALVESFGGEPAGVLMAMLGYDAVAPGAGDFAYGTARLEQAASYAYQNTSLKVLSANTLTKKGNPVFQPYQVYYFNGKTVLVAGLTSPAAAKNDTEGLSFTDPVIIKNAQAAVDMAKSMVDYVVVLGNVDDSQYTAKLICQNIKGIDLFVEASDKPYTEMVNGTTLVGTGAGLQQIGLVDVSVKGDRMSTKVLGFVSASDINDPAHSALAKQYGIASIPADNDVACYLAKVSAAYTAKMNMSAQKAAAEKAAAEKAAAEKAAAEKAAAEKAAVKYPYGVTPIIKAKGSNPNFDLFIVHTNDVHGRLASDGKATIGYPKLSTMLQVARSLTDNILVLDAGDVSQGTNIVNMFQGETAGVMLDMLGYDAVAPGNHDFDFGQDRLIQAAKYADQYTNIKVLSANILDSKGNFLLQPYQIYEFNGFKVAVIGLTTPDTMTSTNPKNVVGLKFVNPLDVLDEAQAAVNMAHKYADYVVVLGHVGINPNVTSGLTSIDICKHINGIDLFIDGHSHDAIEGGKVVNGALIVQAGEYMKNVGVVDVSVRNDKAVGQTETLVKASDVLDPAESKLAQKYGITEVPDDPEVASFIADKQAALDKEYGTVIAKLPVWLDGERADVRTRPTDLSRMICTAMTEATGADFSITNGGGIRASLAAGDVTINDVMTVLPFGNTMTVCELTGEQVYAALEHGYSGLPEPAGSYSQTDLRVVYNKYGKPGKRILRVLVGDKIIKKDSTPYKVCTNDFMVAGGDGYTMFTKVIGTYGMLSDALMDYLKANYPVR